MEILRTGKKSPVRLKVIIILCCTGGIAWLMDYFKTINIYEFIDVTHSNQTVKMDFIVRREKAYQFELLFTMGKSRDEITRRLKLLDNTQSEGTIIPVTLRLIKDGEIIFDEEIDTMGHGPKYILYHKLSKIETVVRNIELFKLPPGYYSAFITTLKDEPALKDIETFVHFRDFP